MSKLECARSTRDRLTLTTCKWKDFLRADCDECRLVDSISRKPIARTDRLQKACRPVEASQLRRLLVPSFAFTPGCVILNLKNLHGEQQRSHGAAGRVFESGANVQYYCRRLQ